jgi:hypothetical protein
MTYLPQFAIGVHCEGDNDLTLYTGSGSFSDWLGLPVHFRTTFPDRTSWSTVATWYYLDETKAWLAADINNYEILSIPLLLGTDTFTTITSGTYDSYFTTLATNIVATGHPDRVIVRLGWEHNGNWWAWSSLSDPAGFAAAFAHVANIAKTIDPTIKFSWCTDVQVNQWSYPTGKTWKDAYPGDASVDVISADCYEEWCNTSTPSVAWANLKSPGSNGVGLDDIVAFASLKGKLFGIEEWSCSTNSGSSGLGDDPTFIDNMQAYCSSNSAFYHCYWNTNLGGPDAAVQGSLSGNVPNAAAEYKTKFGPSTVTTQYLTDPNINVWVSPVTTSTATIKLHAPGGGAGAGLTTDTYGPAAGGSGGNSEQANVSLTAGHSYYYNLGWGGRGGAYGTNNAGQDGSGPCWFGSTNPATPANAICLANPGHGGAGSGSSATTGGAGGSTTGAIGTTKRAGLAGAGCASTSVRAGGGGGESGGTGNGTAGTAGTSTAGGVGGNGNGTASTGGAGGTSTVPAGQPGISTNGGGGGGGGAYDGNGGNGANPSAGGGAAFGSTVNGAGGNGGNGWISIVY